MGEYGKDVVYAATTQQIISNVHRGFQDHCSGKRTHTELTVTEIISTNHPDHEPIRTSASHCNIVAWAKAGHADIKLRTEGRLVLANREYQPAPNRMEGGLGKLDDDVLFGFYDLVFDGDNFEFYAVIWSEPFHGTTRTNYVLASKNEIDADGHSAKVDGLLMASGAWTSDLHNEIYVFDDGEWEKSAKLWTSVQSSNWDDVILDPAMKQTLISDVSNFFDSRALYEEYSVPWKRGIILHGTPGCGKTISIKALVNSAGKRDAPVAGLYVKTLANCNGAHYAVREIFDKARNMAPCLLIFEDLDSLVTDEIRSYFLNEVDGLEDNNGILMIGSTNHLERLDPGISKRPSRFDRKYHFKIPGPKERVQYCQYWKSKLERNSNVDFDPSICDVVAQLTDGFSFAYLKELFVQTLLTLVGGRHMNLAEEDIAAESQIVKGSTGVTLGGESLSSNAEDNDKVPDTNPATKASSGSVPESLKGNALMQILQKQVAVLRKEMDNSKDEGPREKELDAGDEDDENDNEDWKRYRFERRMARQRRMARCE